MTIDGLRSKYEDPWYQYTNWNQFNESKEYSFAAIKLKPVATKDDVDPHHDLRLIGKLE